MLGEAGDEDGGTYEGNLVILLGLNAVLRFVGDLPYSSSFGHELDLEVLRVLEEGQRNFGSEAHHVLLPVKVRSTA